MILKLGMKHQGIELYRVCINHEKSEQRDQESMQLNLMSQHRQRVGKKIHKTQQTIFRHILEQQNDSR